MKYIVSQSLDIRKIPSSQSEKMGILYPGFIIDAIEETEGELLDGEKTWLKDTNGFYYWKGAVNFYGEQEYAPTIINYNELLPDIPSHIRANKGEGITIAVLDTGCINHPDLEGRIRCFYDVKTEQEISVPSDYYDDSDHGTFVTGLMASSGRTSGIVGIAPEVALIIVKVSDNNKFYGDFLFKGLKWLSEQPQVPDIINMSFDVVWEGYQEQINELLQYFHINGCHLVAAGGNNESLFGEKNVFAPASEQHVRAIGSISETFETTEPLNSKITFVVPYGQNYRSLGIGNYTAQKQGCSFSSAVVTAVIALIKSHNKTSGLYEPGDLSDYITQYDYSLHTEQLKIYKNETITA